MKLRSLPLLFALTLPSGGCGKAGSSDKPPLDDPVPTTATPPRSGMQPAPSRPAAKTVNRLFEAVPIETFLVGGLRLPDRLKLRDLTLTFRSNVGGATFQCRSGASQDFVACPGGDSFTFTAMANGSSQAVEVRARAALGQVDTSPLGVAFVVDLDAGALPGDGNALAVTAPASATELASARSLPLGGTFAVAVPGAVETVISSFSTDKTYNGRLETLRLARLSKAPCTRSYELTTTTAAGEAYCMATPTRLQLAADYAEPLPRNHLEVVKFERNSSVPAERLILAAFDADADPAEGHMGVDDSCRGAVASGQTTAVLVRDYYGEPQAGTIRWCQVQDQAGLWWWVAAFSYESAGGRARLKGIYAASAGVGIFSGQDFAQRTGELVRELVVPVTVAP